MRILYLHQHFTTRRGFTGNRSYEFARQFLDRGHQVTMICSGVDNEPRLSLVPGENFRQLEIDGIDCVPIRAAIANPLTITGQTGFRRMLGFLNFVRVAKNIGRRLPRPDVVFATHTPLTIGIAGRDLARHFQVPFVFEVRDLWPQALINLGALRNPLVIAWMRRLERSLYHSAQHIVALSPGMKNGIAAAGVDPSKIAMVPNASDIDLFRPGLSRKFGRDRLGLGDRFAAIYFGGMGMANGLEYAIDAASILRNRKRHDIVVVLHGGGGRRATHQQHVRDLGLEDTVLFSDPVPDKHVVAQLVASCDACLTIYRATREQTWSPNKMFDGLAAGRPIVINVPGWLGETVEQNQCGISVDPNRPESLANALVKLADDPELRRIMGANARKLAEERFSRDQLSREVEQVLQHAIDAYKMNGHIPK